MRHSAAAGMWCFSSHSVSWLAASWVQSLPPVTKSGFEELASARGQCFGIGGAHSARGHRDGGVQGRINLLADDVFRQAHHDGTRPAAHGREHRFRHDLGRPLGMVKDHDAFGPRVEPGLDVEFLERFAVTVGKGDQPDEEQHRGGVLPGGVQPDVGVGRTGPPGDHGHAGTLVHLAVSLGHVGGAALMSADHGIDVGAVQPVQHVQEAFAGNNVGAFDSVGHEGVNNHVPGGFQGAAAGGRADGRAGVGLAGAADGSGCAAPWLGVRPSNGCVWVAVMVCADSVVITACLLGLGCWLRSFGGGAGGCLVGFRSGAEEAAVLAAVIRLAFHWRPVGLVAQQGSSVHGGLSVVLLWGLEACTLGALGSGLSVRSRWVVGVRCGGRATGSESGWR